MPCCCHCAATWRIMQIEGQQSERSKVQQEKAALAKLDRIKQDQGKRADDLEREAADAESKVSMLRKAQLACIDVFDVPADAARTI